MYRIFFYVFLFGIVLAWLPASNAKVLLPEPSPHTVSDKPVKYTAYHSYLAEDGTVKLRRYIKAPTLHYHNPFVGKKIVSIKRHRTDNRPQSDLDKANEMIPKVIRECGSLDAVFVIEAESKWIVDEIASNGDAGLWQWSPIWNALHAKHVHLNWEYQIKTGCEKFRALADVNEVRYSKIWGDWRTGEGGYWHGMANAYSPGVLKRFDIITE